MAWRVKQGGREGGKEKGGNRGKEGERVTREGERG